MDLTTPLHHARMHLDNRARAAQKVFVTGFLLSVTSWYLAHVMLVGR